MFVKKAKKHVSTITPAQGDKRVNTKSPRTLMKAGVFMGDRIIIEGDGPDEADAVAGLTELIASFTE